MSRRPTELGAASKCGEGTCLGRCAGAGGWRMFCGSRGEASASASVRREAMLRRRAIALERFLADPLPCQSIICFRSDSGERYLCCCCCCASKMKMEQWPGGGPQASAASLCSGVGGMQAIGRRVRVPCAWNAGPCSTWSGCSGDARCRAEGAGDLGGRCGLGDLLSRPGRGLRLTGGLCKICSME